MKAKYDLSSMRWLIHAAAPCPIGIKQEMLDWWGPCVWEYYAATEGGGTIASPQDWLAHPGTVGNAWPISELLIADENGNAAADRHARHRLHEDGPRRLRVLTATRPRPRPTGCAATSQSATSATCTPDGFLFLCDRKSDMIISGGANIYPAEIEAEIIMNPKVADVAVFGIPDEEWGEQIKAVVQPAAGVEPGDELAGRDPGRARGPAGQDEMAQVHRLLRRAAP